MRQPNRFAKSSLLEGVRRCSDRGYGRAPFAVISAMIFVPLPEALRLMFISSIIIFQAADFLPGGITEVSRALRSLLWVRGLRDFGDGFVAVLLPIYLTAFGFTRSAQRLLFFVRERGRIANIHIVTPPPQGG